MPPQTLSGNLNTVAWSLQILLALGFVGAALPKLTGDPKIVANFEKIGFGQWFRYLTGILELIGAGVLLVPGYAGFGALMLTGLMLGALLSHFTKLERDKTAVLAVVFLLLSATLALIRWGDVARHLR